MKQVVRIVIFLLLFNNVNAQIFYCIRDTPVSPSVIIFDLVKIDVSQNTMTTICNIPLNYYTPIFNGCYDYKNKIYYYFGRHEIFKIGVVTGNILRNDTIDLPYAEPFYNVVYNPKDTTMYGIVYNVQTLTQWFGKFDPVNWHVTKIRQLNPTYPIGQTAMATIDIYNQHYILQDLNITAINIKSGIIEYDAPVLNSGFEAFDHVAYSCNTSKLYGLSSEYHAEQKYFSAIDSTGTVTHVNPDTLPVYYYSQNLGSCAIDNDNDVFYYPGSGGWLYGVDIHTGLLVYSHHFGPGIELLFIESGSEYNCSIVGVSEISTPLSIQLISNGGVGSYSLIMGKDYSQCDLMIFDTSGRCVFEKKNIKENSYINLSYLRDGIYIYSIISNNSKFTGKLSLIN